MVQLAGCGTAVNGYAVGLHYKTGVTDRTLQDGTAVFLRHLHGTVVVMRAGAFVSHEVIVRGPYDYHAAVAADEIHISPYVVQPLIVGGVGLDIEIGDTY